MSPPATISNPAKPATSGGATAAAAPAGGPSVAPVASASVTSPWTPYAWPTPPLAAYPQPTPSLEPEPCEIEARGGQLMMGTLVDFDLNEGQARVLMPPDKVPVVLRFSQIRRITLKRSLAPLP